MIFEIISESIFFENTSFVFCSFKKKKKFTHKKKKIKKKKKNNKYSL